MATAEQNAEDRPLRHQADRRTRQGDGGEGHPAQARGRRARPHRARPRRDHRHRHLRDHRRGDHDLRAVDRPLLRPRGRHVRLLRPRLRGARLGDPGLGQRVHVLLRDARRARGVDHRLGPDPRVRRLDRRRRRRLGRLPQRAARHPVRLRAAGLDRQPARRRRRQGQHPGGVPRARRGRRADDRRARVRPHEHDHGVLQARRAAAVPGARHHRVHRATTSRRSSSRARASAAR